MTRDEAGKAVDARDWQGALSKLNQITEPTSRTCPGAAGACHPSMSGGLLSRVLYNTAAVHSRLNQLDKARDILLSASQEKGGGGRGLNVEVALHSIYKGEVLPVLLVPEGEVFRPRKQNVEQLGQRDFLGKPMVK
uniref:neutrophil cytosol factor 2-like n=1 Tax=Oncorhynchus gorbuscha TaxID=8017 RepID=UPI001EAE9C60|nr:neutrophil cytosol factor 2-like [Oncorhynchus gorbuscha]